MRKNLKIARKNAGMTQRQVAEYLGVDTRTYQRYEDSSFHGSIHCWDALEDLFKTHQRILRLDMNPGTPDGDTTVSADFGIENLPNDLVGWMRSKGLSVRQAKELLEATQKLIDEFWHAEEENIKL